jgi:hypothetical protein
LPEPSPHHLAPPLARWTAIAEGDDDIVKRSA